MPRGTAWRLECDEPAMVLMIEATNDAFKLPGKGIVGNHAIFDPAILDVPSIDEAFLGQQDENEWSIAIKRQNRVTTVTYPFNPLDATGWHGDLAPVRINWRDIRPMMSARYHLPPSAHTTFIANRVVVCTFVPRPIESDPGALKLPFYHRTTITTSSSFTTRASSSAVTTSIPAWQLGIRPASRTGHTPRLTKPR